MHDPEHTVPTLHYPNHLGHVKTRRLLDIRKIYAQF